MGHPASNEFSVCGSAERGHHVGPFGRGCWPKLRDKMTVPARVGYPGGNGHDLIAALIYFMITETVPVPSDQVSPMWLKVTPAYAVIAQLYRLVCVKTLLSTEIPLIDVSGAS